MVKRREKSKKEQLKLATEVIEKRFVTLQATSHYVACLYPMGSLVNFDECVSSMED